jgi:predicted adenine nucleotide alpha hydrolase (AANH) superfamily ATPase
VVIERLQAQYQLTGFFYNPNIFPAEEYERRRAAAALVAEHWQLPLIVGEYEPERFRTAVKGLEAEPEGGARCPVCFELRLTTTAEQAVRSGFTIIASTLTTGPHKPAPVVNEIGNKVAAQFGLSFLAADWKKQDGFKLSLELARQLNLYRQHYCGCEFSLRSRRGAHR